MDGNERPITPESVWQSLTEKEESGMEMTMTTDQLCAVARRRETGSVWARRIAVTVLLLFAGAFAYNVAVVTQPWVRLGQGWMLAVVGFFLWTILRHGPDRISSNETCASFLQRAFEGSRDKMLEIRRAIFLLVPAMMASWWGKGPALRARALGIDPSSELFRALSGPCPFVMIALALAFIWFAFGRAARKADREIETLHRSVNG